MRPRILIVQTLYAEFLKDIYAQDPQLSQSEFDVQCSRLLGSAFSTGDAYSHEFRSLGCEAWEVICNADAAQSRWASDHRITWVGNIHEQRRQIVAAQVEHFQPDVIYIFEWSPLGDAFVAELNAPGRLVVGEIASPLPADRTFLGYDLMISSWPPIVEHFRSVGIDAEHVRLGFDRRVLDRLKPSERRYDVTFVGGFAPSHPDRIAWLEEILREIPVDVFCYGLERTRPDSPIRDHFRGQAWGWDMYRVLQASKVTLNRHAHLDVRGSTNSEWVNNLRMYEATGVGTCLLTERRRHLDKLFEPDREVATYGDTAECIEKIRYFLAHESQRAAIALAGQKRTLREHLYSHRMAELLEILQTRLRTRPLPTAKQNASRSHTGPRPPTRKIRMTQRVARRLRIGVHPALKRHDGGIYQYTITLLDQLHQLSSASTWEHEFVMFAHHPDDAALRRFNHRNWSVKPFRPPWAPQPSVDLQYTPDPDAPLEQLDLRTWFEECGIDLMLYPAPHRVSFESGVPFVMAVHDIQHALQPHFPEVSAEGEAQRREYVMRNAARTAALLVAESETGREDLLNTYGPFGLTADRVKVLPYLPGSTQDIASARSRMDAIRSRYALPERYLFYPAQLWPHKNHLRLIEALGVLRENAGLTIPLVLTGSASGYIREEIAKKLKLRIHELGLNNLVRMLGYVSDEDIATLYTGATALVMPTFFGPTNIPFLEAWAMECPVLTSRIRGIIEQVGDAALTVDPTDVMELADGIRKLWTDAQFRRNLCERGTARLRAYTPSDFRTRLAMIVDEAASRIPKNQPAAVEGSVQ